MISPGPLRLAVIIEMMIPNARKLSVRRMRSKGSPGLTFSKRFINVPLCNTQALTAESHVQMQTTAITVAMIIVCSVFVLLTLYSELLYSICDRIEHARLNRRSFLTGLQDIIG
jgi:hypothetical protein